MADWAGIIDSILLAAGFSLFIGYMFFPSLIRNTLAMLVNALISPLASHLPFYIVLTFIALVISLTTAFVQKYKTDSKLARHLRKKNAELQKELKEARASGNKTKLKKLEEEQVLLLQGQSKLSLQQMKSMGYTVLVSIPLIIWINWYLGTRPTPITVSLPILGIHAFTETFLIIPYWFIWLTICSFVFGYAIRKIINNKTVPSRYSGP